MYVFCELQGWQSDVPERYLWKCKFRRVGQILFNRDSIFHFVKSCCCWDRDDPSLYRLWLLVHNFKIIKKKWLLSVSSLLCFYLFYFFMWFIEICSPVELQNMSEISFCLCILGDLYVFVCFLSSPSCRKISWFLLTWIQTQTWSTSPDRFNPETPNQKFHGA